MVLRLKTRESWSSPGLAGTRGPLRSKISWFLRSKISGRASGALAPREHRSFAQQNLRPRQRCPRTARAQEFCAAKSPAAPAVPSHRESTGVLRSKISGRASGALAPRERHRPQPNTPSKPVQPLPTPHAGWSSPVARQAHNLKVRGSNPLPATTESSPDPEPGSGLLLVRFPEIPPHPALLRLEGSSDIIPL